MKLFLRWAVSLGALTWLATRVDWPHLAATVQGVEWGWWLAAFAVFLATQLTSGLRWQWLARPLGFTQSLGRFTQLYFVGMFFNLFLPTSVGGDVVRAWYLDGGSGRRLGAFLSVFVDRLSGGERRRVALCKLLLQQPDLLLLDEPTNHLDAESVQWLEQHLSKYPGCVLAVASWRSSVVAAAGCARRWRSTGAGRDCWRRRWGCRWWCRWPTSPWWRWSAGRSASPCRSSTTAWPCRWSRC